MKLVLNIEVEVSERGLAEYYERFPGFVVEGETPAETFFREAVAGWDYENLLAEGVEPVLVQGAELAVAS